MLELILEQNHDVGRAANNCSILSNFNHCRHAYTASAPASKTRPFLHTALSAFNRKGELVLAWSSDRL